MKYLLFALIALISPSWGSPVGSPAPDFTLVDTDGKQVTLSQLKGQIVVLEWFNPECPFVKFAHGSGPLSYLPGVWTDKGVKWIAINSGAPGQQGNGLDKNRTARSLWSMGYPVLLDETGEVGRLYDAKTTPQMVVIDKDGIIRYAGGLDNAPMGKTEGNAVIPHVQNALTAVMTGKAVEVPSSKPYGCSVKYGS
jgi:peroxiredoxin